MTHARAIHLSDSFRLVGAVDPDPVSRDLFLNEYKVRAYLSIEELYSHLSPDCWVIASSTEAHKGCIEQILKYGEPKCILCEKPLSMDLSDAQTIVELCKSKNVKLYVNYMRRAAAHIQEIYSKIKNGRIAPPYKAVVWYSKGILHSGSHFFDLLTFLFGAVRDFTLINQGENLCDYDSDPDCVVTFGESKVFFLSSREDNFKHFSVEVIASNGRLRLENNGLGKWEPLEVHPLILGDMRLGAEAETINCDLSRVQTEVMEQMALAMNHQQHSLCAGECALRNQEWISQIIIESKRQ